MQRRHSVWFRRAGSVALGVALMLFVGGAMAPFSAAAAIADHQMEMNAREAFAAGRFDEALGLFARLYAETLHPVYLRNIGRCHQKMRDPQKAIDSFRDYLAKTKKISSEEKAEVEGYVREMEALRTEQAQAGVVDKRAGLSPTAAPGSPPVVTPITAAAPIPGPANADSSPTLLESKGASGMGVVNGVDGVDGLNSGAQPESAAPIYTRWWLWTGVGAVVVGGIVAAVLLSGGTSRPACPPDVLGCM